MLTSLAKGAAELGFKVGLYKPVAAHNAWFQYGSLVRSADLGLLVGSDVLTYLDMGLVDRNNLHIVNPVDMLTSPPEISFSPHSVKNYLLDLEDVLKQVVLIRITDCNNRSYRHYVLRSNLNSSIATLINELLRVSNIVNAKNVDINYLIKILKGDWISSNLNKCLELISEDNDLIFIESFSDAIVPYLAILDYIDIVVVVSPGNALIYRDIIKFNDAVKMSIKAYGELGLKSSYVITYNELRPDKLIRISPRTSIGTSIIKDFIKEFI